MVSSVCARDVPHVPAGLGRRQGESGPGAGPQQAPADLHRAGQVGTSASKSSIQI